jgi:hypothetical protein
MEKCQIPRWQTHSQLGFNVRSHYRVFWQMETCRIDSVVGLFTHHSRWFGRWKHVGLIQLELGFHNDRLAHKLGFINVRTHHKWFGRWKHVGLMQSLIYSPTIGDLAEGKMLDWFGGWFYSRPITIQASALLFCSDQEFAGTALPIDRLC